jgi:hypothetical protein
MASAKKHECLSTTALLRSSIIVSAKINRVTEESLLQCKIVAQSQNHSETIE